MTLRVRKYKGDMPSRGKPWELGVVASVISGKEYWHHVAWLTEFEMEAVVGSTVVLEDDPPLTESS